MQLLTSVLIEVDQKARGNTGWELIRRVIIL